MDLITLSGDLSIMWEMIWECLQIERNFIVRLSAFLLRFPIFIGSWACKIEYVLLEIYLLKFGNLLSYQDVNQSPNMCMVVQLHV